MSKWGALKQARQRAARMEAKGIITNASETFRNQLQQIDQMEVSRKEKSYLKEQAAKTYMESGYSTATEIHETFEFIGGEYLKERGEAKDTKSEAEFLGATENEKAAILARHYLGSGTVQQLAEAIGDQPGDFYEIIVASVAEYANNPNPDEIQSLINLMVDERKEG